jgi:hypothetical protein
MIRSGASNILLAITLLSPASDAMAGDSNPVEGGEAGDAVCESLPPTSHFGLPQGGTVAAMSVMAGCDGPGWHGFVMEVLSDPDGSEREIQIRFVPGPGGGSESLKWLGKKLLRIKDAESAAGALLPGKNPAWALFYARITDAQERVPTLAVISADGSKQGFKTRTVKFQETGRFFSPILIAGKETVTVLWGEEKEGAARIRCAAVDRETVKGAAGTLVTGDMLDRFQALLAGQRITVAWLRASAGSPDATDVVIETFGLDGKKKDSAAATGLEHDVALTGIRVKGGETVVEGMEARKGRWRPFEVTVEEGSGKTVVSRKGKPVIDYTAGFAALSDVILWKKKHERSAVTLEFFGRSYTVSQEGAVMPLALSLCSSSAVGAWVHEAEGIGGVVRYFDFELKDSDGDGVLDAFDACEGEGPAPDGADETEPGE